MLIRAFIQPTTARGCQNNSTQVKTPRTLMTCIYVKTDKCNEQICESVKELPFPKICIVLEDILY